MATFQWNNAEHLEAYFAVPSMGAVLHTLNIRLFPEQLTYIANHAEDRVVIVDDSLVDLLAQGAAHVRDRHPRAGRRTGRRPGEPGSAAGGGRTVRLYEDLLADQPDTYDWPELDERDAAAMCYTSGTTGNPKGVVYSHRSAYLHSMAIRAVDRRGHLVLRPGAAHRAHVPRQRVGAGLRRGDGRRRPC